jgi:hypothetical protein
VGANPTINLDDIKGAVCRIDCVVYRENHHILEHRGSGVMLEYPVTGTSTSLIVFTAAQLFDGFNDGNFRVCIGGERGRVFTANVLCKSSGEQMEEVDR